MSGRTSTNARSCGSRRSIAPRYASASASAVVRPEASQCRHRHTPPRRSDAASRNFSSAAPIRDPWSWLPKAGLCGRSAGFADPPARSDNGRPNVGATGTAMSERETMEYDVVVVGAGPAGLAFAIRLKQLRPDARVCVIEKASTVGAHILSGAVIEPAPLDALLPGWRDNPPPICVPATHDEFLQ